MTYKNTDDWHDSVIHVITKSDKTVEGEDGSYTIPKNTPLSIYDQGEALDSTKWYECFYKGVVLDDHKDELDYDFFDGNELELDPRFKNIV